MVAQSLTDIPLIPAAVEGARAAGLSRPNVIMRDRRQVEVRQAYPLPSRGETTNYTLDLFLFLPRTMGVNPATYPKADFYTDTHVYMRLDAPGRTVAELADLKADQRSPLAQVHATLPRLLEARAPQTEPLVSLCQLHAHELSEAVVASFSAAARSVRDGDFGSPDAFEKHVQKLLVDSELSLVALRQVRAEAEAFGPLCHPGLQRALEFSEEYFSAVLDEQVALLSEAVRDSATLRDGSGTAVRVLLHLAAFAVEESKLRLEAGYAVPWDDQREYFAYRLGLLKKELQQALYLNTRELKGDNYIRNSAAMVAAGLAATWAFVTQANMQLGQVTTGTQYALLGSAVGAYMLKDRIKEWTRDYLLRRVKLDDYSRAVVPETLARFGLHGVGGRARERMRFVKPDDVEPEVRALRLFHRSVMGTGVELEEVIHYRRRLTLSATDKATVPPGFGIREILRLNTHALTRRLDDPLDEVTFYDAPNGRFRRDSLPKVYHANLVVKVAADHAPLHWVSRSRLVLNQDGLVRVEPVVTRTAVHHARGKRD